MRPAREAPSGATVYSDRGLQPAPPSTPGDHGRVRTVGVEEELLVVGPDGRPAPLGPEALEVAARRGQGETVEEHDNAEHGDQGANQGANQGEDDGGTEGAHLVPELKAQQ